MQDLYVNDENFKGYVERYRAKHNISAAAAMAHMLVREYGEERRKKRQEAGNANSTHTPMGECV